MIEIKSVSHAFGERPVLRDVSVSIAERRVAVIGANGSGKSTFLRLLNGLLLPDDGQVRVDGLDTRADTKAVRRRVGFVFQNPDNQIVFPTVAEDLAFGLQNQRLDRAEIDRRVDEVLDRYDLSDLRDHPAHRLSGGQKQLLALGGVLMMRPAYLVLDEPTTLLDMRNARRIAEALDALDETVVLATHDLEMVAAYDRVIVFDEGRVVADDTPAPAVAYYRRLMC